MLLNESEGYKKADKILIKIVSGKQIKVINPQEKFCGFFICMEGISQTVMFPWQFGIAHELEMYRKA